MIVRFVSNSIQHAFDSAKLLMSPESLRHGLNWEECVPITSVYMSPAAFPPPLFCSIALADLQMKMYDRYFLVLRIRRMMDDVRKNVEAFTNFERPHESIRYDCIFHRAFGHLFVFAPLNRFHILSQSLAHLSNILLRSRAALS